jgi:hypothetical protein
MVDNQEYYGFSNRSTWLVKLWLDSTLEAEEYMLMLARVEKIIGGNIQRLATKIKEYIREAKPQLLNSVSLLSDLIDYDLSKIDWVQLAQKYLEDVEKQDK